MSNVDVLTYAGNLANLDGVAEEHGERYEFFKADIANADQMDALMTEHSFYAVINFAAESHVDRSINDPQNFIHTNIVGTSVLLDCARRHGVQRFLQISTDEVYGSLGATGKFTEQSPLEPSSPYSASKAGADLVALACHKTFGQEVIVTRCSNNYGPYQFPEKLIPLMIIKAMRDEPLPVYGDGKNVRDWIHVEDHCAGIVAALFEGKSGAVYNFGGDSEMPNIETVKAILKKLGKPESLISYVTDRLGHDRRYAIDSLCQAAEWNRTTSGRSRTRRLVWTRGWGNRLRRRLGGGGGRGGARSPLRDRFVFCAARAELETAPQFQGRPRFHH